MIKNIVFDIGKVLVYFEPEKVMDELGFSAEAKETIIKELFEKPLWEEGDRGALSIAETLQMYIEGAPQYEAEIRSLYENVDRTITMMPHTIPWMKELKERGYKLYIISNYAENTFYKTEEKLEFLQYVDGDIFSYRYKLLKPEPAIYNLLLDTYGLKAQESVFIDDRDSNVEGAIAVGFKGIQFHTYEQAKKELEDML